MRRFTRSFSFLLLMLVLALLQATCAVRAHVLDDFNDNKKTDWTDFTFVPNFGLPKEQNGQFQFSLPPAGQALFVASTKTSETFTVADGRTVEFRVDLVSGNGKDAFAILAFIPKASTASSLAGYGFAKSTTDILLTKGIGKYFYNQNPPDPLKNENVTMVLSLTGKGSDVIINAKLLDKDNANAVIFEKTFIDTPAAEILDDGADSPAAPYMGPGNFVLYCYEDFDKNAPQGSYDVVFDNAETYFLENTVLDDFNDNKKTSWTDFTFVPNFGLPVEANGQFTFELPPAGQALFVASTKTSRSFDLVEGERIEFNVDLIEGNGKDAFAILAFIPNSSDASTLAGYGFAKSTTDILLTKGIGKYFYNQNPADPIKNENVRLKLSLTAKGGNVFINGQVLDLDNANAVLFDKTFIDTPAAEILDDGADSPPAPYLGSGHFVLYCYEDFDKNAPQAVYKVVFDNAVVASAPLPANTPPVISDILPGASASFLPTTAKVSFKVTDDKALTNDKISVVLNGQTFTTANGLTLVGSGTSRTGSLGGLVGNTTYSAVIRATDSDNAASSATIYFDTFTSADTIVEVEDFNFSSGQFVDNPVPIAEGTGPQSNAYANQAGTPDVDYSDTRTDFRDVPYRPDDHPRMRQSLDFPRQKFADAGGTDAGGTDAGVYDYDLGDIVSGEWLNYTRTFAPGTYEVYLRESLVNGSQVEAALQEITSDPAQPDQTVRALGSFRTTTTGFQFRNIPLTDALGQNKVFLRLSGVRTFRLYQLSSEPSDGLLFQNYLVFIPVPNAPVQRALVSALSPANLDVVETMSLSVSATIQNRETSVQANTIKLFVNDAAVAATVTPSAEGASVTYAIATLPPPNSLVTARLEFKDNEGTAITTAWSFTVSYKSLDAANRASGTGEVSGLNLRFVQAPPGSNLENSLLRAEAQLAPNSSIAKATDASTVVQLVNFNQQEGDAGTFGGDIIVPGLDAETNGTDDFAVEMTTWLDLSAGAHRFGVVSDDGYKISAPATPGDRSAAPLAFHTGGTANETFDFYVPKAGLYPFRMVWYERGGGAHAEWFSVDMVEGTRTLINDPDNPQAIKAYASIKQTAPAIQLLATPALGQPFTVQTGAAINEATGQIAIVYSGATKFYQLGYQGPKADVKIKTVEIQGNNVVLTYSVTPRP